MKALLIPMLAVAALPLAGCGSTQALKPAAGQSLPVTPYGAPQQPVVADLLTPSVQARPQRTGEVLRSSQKREPDPFDLPPR
ncbi:putative lipoprotein YmbA [Sphingomonas sp. BE138]|uniref:hypothetical protein n=1 Tax=Sphingomonas sp. BE138 TaxID=2817845 RepID=UPI002855F4A2|nr:hypothetical protein [Sphingomonas sp. BE138]MDR6788993.1 putative lipoprotein YmbA [Sphingomonas sp. BE138]